MGKKFELPCPKCKKNIAISAEICPYCQTVFTPDEIKKRKKQGCGIFALAAFLLLGLIGYCSGDSSPSADNASEANASAPVSPVAATEGNSTSLKPQFVAYYKGLVAEGAKCDQAYKVAMAALNEVTETGDAVAAYSSAKDAKDICEEATATINALSKPEGLGGEAAELMDKAHSSCSDAYGYKAMGIDVMMTAINGDTRPSVLTDMKEKFEASQSLVIQCVTGVLLAGEKSGIKSAEFQAAAQ